MRILHRYDTTATFGSLDVIGSAEMDPSPLCKLVERWWRCIWLHGVQEGVALYGNV